MTNSEQNIKSDIIPDVRGLVLVGGKSTRMGKDKSQLNYFGKPQKEIAKQLLESKNLETFYSVQKSKNEDEISDIYPNLGPIGGIYAAFQKDPNSAWFVLATDVPFVNKEVINLLLENRNQNKVATSIKGKNKDFIEPLISIYEPKAFFLLKEYVEKGIYSPMKLLMNSEIEIVEVDDNLIRNINTPEEFEIAKSQIDG